MKDTIVSILFLLIGAIGLFDLHHGHFVPSDAWKFFAFVPALLLGWPFARYVVRRLTPVKRSPLYGKPSSFYHWVLCLPIAVLCVYPFVISVAGTYVTIELGSKHVRLGEILSWRHRSSRRGPDCTKIVAVIQTDGGRVPFSQCLPSSYPRYGFTGPAWFNTAESPLGTFAVLQKTGP
ncbi:hypothetical protein [Silanimonas sp.]|uniref:hypothetical protein n=1 Tax=Silanimonas sp. TaxID=1929290 RepID=UPI0022BE8088|nr:hypothetical protein [Silanimonas sp.]MCZ8063586.1 hypothetical protein [Silanimonas sp.]